MALEFDVEKLTEEWANDCSINELDLADSIRNVPKLHAKWIQLLSRAKLRRRKWQSQYNTLRQIKFKYYRGELTKEELDAQGWAQWQGVKPLRNDMDEFLKGDADLAKYEDRLEYMEVVVAAIEQIIRSINSRGYDIKTMLEAKKFYNGMN